MNTFYLGTIALKFVNFTFNNLSLSDYKFNTPVLPISTSYTIIFQKTDKLELPSSPSTKVGNIDVWKIDNTEIRLYNLNSLEPYMMSSFNHQTIIIYVLKTSWEKHLSQFRPWFNIHLEWLLLQNDAFVLHSASIIVNGKAILFTAPSGTGKTTQTNLWRKYRHNVSDLNGDRTLLQKTSSGWYACGFPLYGSINRCEQQAVPIAGIVIVRQNKKDLIEELSSIQKISLLYSETTVFGSDCIAVNNTLALLEDLIQNTTVLKLHCTMQESAVNLLENYLQRKGEL